MRPMRSPSRRSREMFAKSVRGPYDLLMFSELSRTAIAPGPHCGEIVKDVIIVCRGWIAGKKRSVLTNSTSSIPNVRLVPFDFVLSQPFAQLVLKRLHGVVLFLIENVCPHRLD